MSIVFLGYISIVITDMQFYDVNIFLINIYLHELFLLITFNSYSILLWQFEGQSETSSQNKVDVHENNLDSQAEDRELKVQLLRKYSGYLGSLKKEFLKKKKNGKLPKEARQQLLDWWNRHYKWPYPSVTKFYIHYKP